MGKINIVFDGPPSHESGRFVEVEDSNGHSIRVGSWVHREDGLWALELTNKDFHSPSAISSEVRDRLKGILGDDAIKGITHPKVRSLIRRSRESLYDHFNNGTTPDLLSFAVLLAVAESVMEE